MLHGDAKEKGAKLEAEWNELFAQYQAKYPAEAAEFVRRMDKNCLKLERYVKPH